MNPPHAPNRATTDYQQLDTRDALLSPQECDRILQAMNLLPEPTRDPHASPLRGVMRLTPMPAVC